MAGGNIGGLRLQGYFYHLTQASWRKIQQLGLVPLYNNDDDFRLFCGMMEGLAFLPVPDLTNGIHLLRTLCPDDPSEAAELLDYLDSTYISGRLRHQWSISQKVVSLRSVVSVNFNQSKAWKSHLRQHLRLICIFKVCDDSLDIEL
jgi:hypothetical protein